jgi:CheY-like chemotaxis protein
MAAPQVAAISSAFTRTNLARMPCSSVVGEGKRPGDMAPVTSCDYSTGASRRRIHPGSGRRPARRRGLALILILVDDDPDIRRGVATLLRSHGHNVHAYPSAEGCLAEARHAACAIVDVVLPGMDGLELHRQLQAAGRRLPVIFITANDELELLTAIQRTRQPLIRKPLDEDALLDAIARATVTQ